MRTIKKFSKDDIRLMGKQHRSGLPLVKISQRWQIPYRTLLDHKVHGFYLEEEQIALGRISSCKTPEEAEKTLRVEELNTEDAVAIWSEAIPIIRAYSQYIKQKSDAGIFDCKEIEILSLSVVLMADVIDTAEKSGLPHPLSWAELMWWSRRVLDEVNVKCKKG